MGKKQNLNQKNMEYSVQNFRTFTVVIHFVNSTLARNEDGIKARCDNVFQILRIFHICISCPFLQRKIDRDFL